MNKSLQYRFWFSAVAMLAIGTSLSTQAQGTWFTYQGMLSDGSAPANGTYDIRFALYDGKVGGSQQGPVLTNTATAVTNGLFTVSLDFGDQFSGAERWLEIAVRSNGAGFFNTLTPRQAVSPSPYAMTAGRVTGVVSSGSLAGTYASVLAFNNPSNMFSGSGASLTSLNASQLTAGTVPDGRLSANVSLLGPTIDSAEITDGTITPNDLDIVSFSTTFWRASGNAGTTPGTHFLGTVDNQPLEFKVNNRRALRLEPTAINDTVNVLGGSARNVIGTGVIGATIAGGGVGDNPGGAYSNRVDANFGVISGGYGNGIESLAEYSTIAGGSGNAILRETVGAAIAGGGGNTIRSNASFSTLGGGASNEIQPNSRSATIAGGLGITIENAANSATVGGGEFSTIQSNATHATIAGGGGNLIRPNSTHSTIGGGSGNVVLPAGTYAVIPGGRDNAATNYGFAAGRQAKAIHSGSFVWADSIGVDFASSASNQFLIRATGGVGVNKSNPSTALDVNGTVAASGFSGHGGGLTNLNATNLIGAVPGASLVAVPAASLVGTISDARLSASVSLLGPSIDSAEITDGTIAPVDLNLAAFNSTFWRPSGNAGTTPGNHFLGTSDNQALELKVNSQRGLRLEPTGSNDTVNIIGGSARNVIGAGVQGATIGGGGSGNHEGIGLSNRVDAHFGVISGGTGNAILSNALYSTIVGGANNVIQTNAYAGFIGGGVSSTIQLNSPYSTIGGGGGNVIQSNAYSATIGGGGFNTIQSGASHATLGGGYLNIIQPSAIYATISGGNGNSIQTNSFGSSIGGGIGNVVQSSTSTTTIAGGENNTIEPGVLSAAIGGGTQNRIQFYANYATLSGGYRNFIQSNATSATIVGGDINVIEAGALAATIGGGGGNHIQPNGSYGTIPGGRDNTATNGAFAAGTQAQANHTGAFVWADAAGTDFRSTGDNQFLVRAAGGVGVNKNNPATALDVNGVVTASGFSGNGASLTSLNASQLTGSVPDERLSANVALRTGGNTFTGSQAIMSGTFGVGTTSPLMTMDVRNTGNTGGSIHVGENSTAIAERMIHFGDLAGGTRGYVAVGEAEVDDRLLLIGGSVVFTNLGGTGFVGIGRVAAGNKLEVEGNASKTTAGGWLANSDARIKHDIQPITGALDKLAQVRLVSFRYSDDYRRSHPSVDDRQYLNVVAQEFREVFPDHVKSSGEKLADGSEILQVDTYPLTIYSAAAIQELNAQVRCLKDEMKRRDLENAALRQRLEKLERLMSREKD